MTYQNFLATILANTKEHFNTDTDISIHSILKNNNVRLDGLTIMTDGFNISPTIYLNEYYEEYKHGKAIHQIMDDILHIYRQNQPNESVDASFYTEFSNISDKILYKLVNYKENEALLHEIPHFRFLDLAIVFYCMISTTPRGSATILIYNDHLSYWNITRDILHQHAITNTPSRLPCVFRSITDILSELMAERAISNPFANTSKEDFTSLDKSMYVLTNKQKLYGASCLIYPSVLSDIAKKLQCDYYILPSSIHEVLLIPARKEFTEEELNDMVLEVNETQVATEELLSDHVYFYSCAKGTLCL